METSLPCNVSFPDIKEQYFIRPKYSLDDEMVVILKKLEPISVES